ncbi:MAG: hypothetical protein ABW133_17875 [Polyangiaceae bacterium]
MTRFASLASVAAVSTIIACAGSRKGADAGGGSSPAGANSGTPGATLASSNAPPAGPAPNAASSKLAGQGQPCEGETTCTQGLTCVSYYGFAGAAGPKFTSCEIKCNPSGKPPCPSGQNCVTIADGPGAVCRPSDM